MLIFTRKHMKVALVVFLVPVAVWAQTSQPGNATQYVITQSQGTAVLQPQNPYSGSVPATGKAAPNVLPLSLKEAIERGLKQNLGLLLSGDAVPFARGQYW